jgi:hypothetical protein
MSSGSLAAGRDFSDRLPERTGGLDAAARCDGLRSGGLGQEEGDDPIADVSADQAAGLDHTPIRRPCEAAAEGEVARRGKATREWRGAFEVGEEDGRRAPPRPGDARHPLEVVQVTQCGDCPDRRHPHRRHRQVHGSDDLPPLVADAHGKLLDLERKFGAHRGAGNRIQQRRRLLRC